MKLNKHTNTNQKSKFTGDVYIHFSLKNGDSNSYFFYFFNMYSGCGHDVLFKLYLMWNQSFIFYTTKFGLHELSHAFGKFCKHVFYLYILERTKQRNFHRGTGKLHKCNNKHISKELSTLTLLRIE